MIMLCMNIYFLTPKILIEGVSNVVSESLINNTNKQVFHGEDVGVNDCIGDDMLNEIDKVAKKLLLSVEIMMVVWVMCKKEM